MGNIAAAPVLYSRFRWSIRVLLLVVAMLAVPVAWKTNRARAQRRAVAVIKKKGGYVGYDYEFRNGQPVDYSQGHPDAPQWLRRALGDEFFQEVTYVYCPYEINQFWPDGLASAIREKRRRSISDEDLQYFKCLDHLQTVSIESNDVTDAGFANFENLRSLQSLEVISSRVTQTAIQRLKRALPRVELITLQDRQAEIEENERMIAELNSGSPLKSKEDDKSDSAK
jgi:hypothetical protein